MRGTPLGQRDTVGFTDGDRAWIGIDMTRDKPLVQPGYLSEGRNTRLRTGKAKQRLGNTIPPDFNPVAGFGNFLIGSGVFRDPNGDERLMVAPANTTYVWALQDAKDPVQINFAGGVASTGTLYCEFTQAFDQLLLFRAITSPANLVWDGDNTHTFNLVTLAAGGNTLVPPATSAEPFQDRVVYFIITPKFPSRDQLIVSDDLDYTSYDPAYQQLRVNSAESDFITSVSQYFRGSILVWKNQSIHMVTDLGVLPFQAGFRILAPALGSIGRYMPLEVGGDYIFLNNPRGFYRLSEIIQEQIVTLPLPISEKIQPVIDTINWGVTQSLGCSVAMGEYAFFGVATGAAPRALNAILVYNTQTREWESAGDTWSDPDFFFHRLHITNYNGVQRIFAIDYTNSAIYVLYEGLRDELKNGTFSIPYRLTTRGYVGDDAMAFKQFGRLSVSISTYDPLANVTAIMDGFNEEFQLTDSPISKDRNTYYTHGVATFDPETGNFDAPFREDYSIENFDNVAIDDFEALPEGPISYIPPTGTSGAVSDKQESLERFWIRENGRWCALKIENEDGLLELNGVSIEGRKVSETLRVVA